MELQVARGCSTERGFSHIELQHLHALFNYYFFGNKLRPLFIFVMPGHFKSDEKRAGIEARFSRPFPRACYKDYDPGTIDFFIDTETEDREYVATMLLHEMVHQFCYENGIEDIDEEGKHNAAFVEEAGRHGLTQRGYRLTDEAREMMVDYLRILPYRESL